MLVKTKNYKTAADQLFISQPTLSRHIKEIEDELGISLFKRSTRKTELTDYGLFFLPYAKEIVDAEDGYIKGLVSMLEINNNTIFAGTVPQADPEFTEIISTYQHEHPKIRFKTCRGESEDLRKELISGELEFIFIREAPPYNFQESERITLATTPLKVVLPKNHALAAKSEIHIDELRNESFLMSEDSSLAYRLATALSHEHGFELNIVFQGSRTQILNLVQRNAGISILFPDVLNMTYDNISVATLLPITNAEINCVYVAERLKEKKYADFTSFVKCFRNGKKIN